MGAPGFRRTCEPGFLYLARCELASFSEEKSKAEIAHFGMRTVRRPVEKVGLQAPCCHVPRDFDAQMASVGPFSAGG